MKQFESRFLVTTLAVAFGITGVTQAATSLGTVNSIGNTGSTLNSVTVDGNLINAGDLTAGTPNAIAASPGTRTIVGDGGALPGTNQGVWDLVGDLTLNTGHQDPLAAGSRDYFFASPLKTTGAADVVMLSVFSNGADFTVEALDANGNVIAGTDLLFNDAGNALGIFTGDTDFNDVVADGAPGAAPVYGSTIDVGSLELLGHAFNFDANIVIGGIRVTSSGTATELIEVQGLAPIVPEPASLALLGLGGLMMLRRRKVC